MFFCVVIVVAIFSISDSRAVLYLPHRVIAIVNIELWWAKKYSSRSIFCIYKQIIIQRNYSFARGVLLRCDDDDDDENDTIESYEMIIFEYINFLWFSAFFFFFFNVKAFFFLVAHREQLPCHISSEYKRKKNASRG